MNSRANNTESMRGRGARDVGGGKLTQVVGLVLEHCAPEIQL